MTVKNAKIKKESEVAKKPKADFELSAGALVFRRTNQGIVWLVLHYTAGHWDFPKGHVEKGETMIDAARREVLEEAGIKDLKFYPEFKRPLQYFFNAAKYSGSSTKQMVFKKVVFHLAETKEEEIKISFEHLEGKWLSSEAAEDILTFKDAKKILKAAVEFIQQNILNAS